MYKAERTTLTGQAYERRPKKKGTLQPKPSQAIFVLPVKAGMTMSEVVYVNSPVVSTQIIKFDPVKAAHEGADLRLLDLLEWYHQNVDLLSQSRRAQLRGMLGDAVAILCRDYPTKMSASKMMRIRVTLGEQWVDTRLMEAGIDPTAFPSATI